MPNSKQHNIYRGSEANLIHSFAYTYTYAFSLLYWHYMGNSTSSMPWDLKCKICRKFIESPFRNFNWTTNENQNTPNQEYSRFLCFFFWFWLYFMNVELCARLRKQYTNYIFCARTHLCANCTATSLNCDFISNLLLFLLLLLLLLFLPSLNCIFVIPMVFFTFRVSMIDKQPKLTNIHGSFVFLLLWMLDRDSNSHMKGKKGCYVQQLLLVFLLDKLAAIPPIGQFNCSSANSNKAIYRSSLTMVWYIYVYLFHWPLCLCFFFCCIVPLFQCNV